MTDKSSDQSSMTGKEFAVSVKGNIPEEDLPDDWEEMSEPEKNDYIEQYFY